MPAKKSDSSKSKSKIEIKTRTPASKPGIFDNIGKNRSREQHPLTEIINFPVDSVQLEENSLDSQNSLSRTAKTQETGNPNLLALDNQKDVSGNPNTSASDSQTTKLGQPSELILDSPITTAGNPNLAKPDFQNQKLGNPNDKVLDSQSKESGKPKTGNLDSSIAKERSRISKDAADLDSNISESKNLDSQKPAKPGKWEKYEKNRPRKGIFLRTDDDLTKQFKQFCIAQELEFSVGTELAWQKFMSDLDSQKTENLAIKIASNNKELIKMYKSKPDIITLYYRYNQFFSPRVRWTPKDDRIGATFNEVDPRVIELGIIQTQCNLYAEGTAETTTINGFQYYANEIKRFMMYDGKPEILDTIVKINRETWTATTGKKIDYSEIDSKKND